MPLMAFCISPTNGRKIARAKKPTTPVKPATMAGPSISLMRLTAYSTS